MSDHPRETLEFPSVRATARSRFELVRQERCAAIDSGECAPGTVLPSETALARSFGVSVGTVRRALSDLAQEGLLSRRRKTGTVVTGRGPRHSLRHFYDYFRLHGADGRLQHSRSEPLSFATVSATAVDAARLAVATGEPLYRYHRLRVVGERPVMHDICLFSCERFPGFPSRLKDVPELL
ncbi:MAG: GntR family transcriptional regulator, partial [Pikeienuella sp.]